MVSTDKKMFSKSCEYGLKAVSFIALQSLENRRVKLSEISNSIESPEAFTAKVLGILAQHNIIDSVKGPYGGFEMNIATMKMVNAKKIVEAIDGSSVFTSCVMGLSKCNHSKPCPLHYKFYKIRNQLDEFLGHITVYDMVKELKQGKSFINLYSKS